MTIIKPKVRVKYTPGKGWSPPYLKPQVEIGEGLAELLGSPDLLDWGGALPIALGKDQEDKPYVFDLTTAPHLLVAGSTGQGKSNTLLGIIASLLVAKDPRDTRLVLIDTKAVEFTCFDRLANMSLVESVITETPDAVRMLNRLCVEMDNRYQLLRSQSTRNIAEYLNSAPKIIFPYIVLVIDEFADLILSEKRSVEDPLIRLAQKARAAGIHLVIATQRPSVDVITGLIKSNFPSRIAFRTASSVDSRTILDVSDAFSLKGKGDSIISLNGENHRVQAGRITDDVINNIVGQITKQTKIFPEVYSIPDGETYKPTIIKLPKEPLFPSIARWTVALSGGYVINSEIQKQFGVSYQRSLSIVADLQRFGFITSGFISSGFTRLKTQEDVERYLINFK